MSYRSDITEESKLRLKEAAMRILNRDLAKEDELRETHDCLRCTVCYHRDCGLSQVMYSIRIGREMLEWLDGRADDEFTYLKDTIPGGDMSKMPWAVNISKDDVAGNA